MKTKHIVILSVIALFLIIGVFAYVNITTSHTVVAKLEYGSGEVFVNSVAVRDNMLLKEGDIITTQDGTATITVYESIFVQLKPNTTFELTDLDKISPTFNQTQGETYINFVHTTSVKDFQVYSDEDVYHINGTFFSLGETKMIVLYGIVHVTRGNTKFLIRYEPDIDFGYVFMYNKETGESEFHELTDAEVREIEASVSEAIRILRQQRQDEVDKSPNTVSILSKAAGITESEFLSKINDYDAGTPQEVDELVAKSPVNVESINKVAELTKEIQIFMKYLLKFE
jgi:hypothetical protein